MRALVVEDELRLAAGLRNGLEAEGYAVDVALTGTDGLWLAREHGYDVVLLDLMLPEVDGFEICATLRSERVWTPILLLTARDADSDQIRALDTGADDYLTKPFSPKELAARIKAVLRRRAPQLSGDVIEVEGLRLDPVAHRVTASGERLYLAPSEFRLLQFLMAHPARIYSRAQLLDQVWGDHVYVEERTVDVHIRRLRKALTPTGHDRLIATVRGTGYGFQAD
jgi:phosphate regulon transcriptional regulator PhoB